MSIVHVWDVELGIKAWVTNVGAAGFPYVCVGLDTNQPNLVARWCPLLLLPVQQEPTRQPIPLVHIKFEHLPAYDSLRSL
jgi:hypothetical protein